MKFLLSPVGLILIVAILVVLFWPRRAPDAVAKSRVRHRMKAFEDDESQVPDRGGPGSEGAESGDGPTDSKGS